MRITGNMRVGDVMRNYPNTRSIFMRYGICDCCGGELSIEETARSRDIDIEALIRNLNVALEYPDEGT
ncbi:MAG: DUF542 domain-containing protein [Candidatus Hydrothermarchaeales archaeon]